MSKLRAFTMPKWGIEMSEGRITEWSVGEGTPIRKGQVLAHIETDKIVNEVEAEFDGTIARLVAEAGELYSVGSLLAVLAIEPVSASEIDLFISSFESGGAATRGTDRAMRKQPAGTGQEREEKLETLTSQQYVGTGVASDLLISPAARQSAAQFRLDLKGFEGSGRHGRITLQDVEQLRKPVRELAGRGPVSIKTTADHLDSYYASPASKVLAAHHALDLAQVRGTGPRGRISQTDVLLKLGIPLPTQTAAGTNEVCPMSPMRKAIARQMTAAKSTIPHFYLRAEVDFERLLSLRSENKVKGAGSYGINDYVLRACALALVQVPEVNIQVHGDSIHRFGHAAIAIAVATDRGLITPVLRAADMLSVAEISQETARLIERARSAKLRQEEIENATFSVSNLGMFGIDQFDAIINPPQGSILAVGAISRRPRENVEGIRFRSTAWLSLGCDHRGIDGALGAKFLSAVRELIENPERL